jgi:hypothetical protein
VCVCVCVCVCLALVLPCLARALALVTGGMPTALASFRGWCIPRDECRTDTDQTQTHTERKPEPHSPYPVTRHAFQLAFLIHAVPANRAGRGRVRQFLVMAKRNVAPLEIAGTCLPTLASGPTSALFSLLPKIPPHGRRVSVEATRTAARAQESHTNAPETTLQQQPSALLPLPEPLYIADRELARSRDKLQRRSQARIDLLAHEPRGSPSSSFYSRENAAPRAHAGSFLHTTATQQRGASSCPDVFLRERKARDAEAPHSISHAHQATECALHKEIERLRARMAQLERLLASADRGAMQNLSDPSSTVNSEPSSHAATRRRTRHSLARQETIVDIATTNVEEGEEEGDDVYPLDPALHTRGPHQRDVTTQTDKDSRNTSGRSSRVQSSKRSHEFEHTLDGDERHFFCLRLERAENMRAAAVKEAALLRKELEQIRGQRPA